eukprot:2398068-Rhodomonas_salina.1
MAATPLPNYTHFTTDMTPRSSQELYPLLTVLRRWPRPTDQEVAFGTKTDQAVTLGLTRELCLVVSKPSLAKLSHGPLARAGHVIIFD